MSNILLDINCDQAAEDRFFIHDNGAALYLCIDYGEEEKETQIKLNKTTATELAEAMVEVLDYYERFNS